VAPDGRRICRLSTAAAGKLGLGAGDIIELVNPMGAPLRAWIDEVGGDGGDLAWLAADACTLLAAGGESVEIRRIAAQRGTQNRLDGGEVT
jgi:hypothetical protein